MRDENARAEKSHQYCCKLNHDTRPYAQPALVTGITHIGRFVSGRFRRVRKMVSSPVLQGSCAFSRALGSQVFYPLIVAARGCKPDQEFRRIWEPTASIIAPSLGPIRTFPDPDIGERTWVKSSGLSPGQNWSAPVSNELAARRTTTLCRKLLR